MTRTKTAAEKWEDIHAARPWGKYPCDQFVSFVYRNYKAVPKRSAARFLDLGAGAGANTLFLASEGFTVLAVDGSVSALNRIRQRSEEMLRPHDQARIAYICSELERYEPFFPADCFVDVCAMQYMTHDAARALADRCWNALPVGGRFFSKTAGPAWDPEVHEIPVFRRTYERVYDIFNRWKIELGHETIRWPRYERPTTDHWIIEAVKE